MGRPNHQSINQLSWGLLHKTLFERRQNANEVQGYCITVRLIYPSAHRTSQTSYLSVRVSTVKASTPTSNVFFQRTSTLWPVHLTPVSRHAILIHQPAAMNRIGARVRTPYPFHLYPSHLPVQAALEGAGQHRSGCYPDRRSRNLVSVHQLHRIQGLLRILTA